VAIVKCPDCKKDVSSQAPACPSCGHPMAATTVEATGKKWKKMKVICFAVSAVGGLIIFSDMGHPGTHALIGTVILFGGFIGVGVANSCAWWFHD